MNTLGLSATDLIDILESATILALALLLGRWLIGLLLDRIARRAVGYTRTDIDDRIIEAVRSPLYLLTVVLALAWALGRLEFIVRPYRADLNNAFFILYLTVAFLAGWRLIVSLSDWYGVQLSQAEKAELSGQLLPLLRRFALILLMAHFDIEITGLVATLGIGSLAIALAAQASLSDIFSGIVILVDRPYRVGDRIEIQDLNTWGDVTDIGLRSSRVRTRDNRLVIVPNSLIGKSLIVNHSYPDDNYRIQFHVGVAYGTDIELARRTMIGAAGQVEGILANKPVEALFVEMGESAMIFRVRVWIKSFVDTRRVTDKLNSAVYRALDEAGVLMPFPQMDVHHHIESVDPQQLRALLAQARETGAE